MRILALDTSTPTGSVAVWEDGLLLGCASWQSTASHATQLLTATSQVLRLAGIAFASVDMFAVACGPGSFTGLRVGIATAKGWGQATQKPVAPIASLDALAQHGRYLHGTLCASLDARKHEVYAALYAVARGRVHKLTADLVLAPQHLDSLNPQPDYVLGSGVTAYAEEMRCTLGNRVMLLGADPKESPVWFPTAPYVASLAAQSMAGRQPQPLAAVQPRYVRSADAEFKAQAVGSRRAFRPAPSSVQFRENLKRRNAYEAGTSNLDRTHER